MTVSISVANPERFDADPDPNFLFNFLFKMQERKKIIKFLMKLILLNLANLFVVARSGSGSRKILPIRSRNSGFNDHEAGLYVPALTVSLM